jgi:hypothetical protein
MTRLHLTLAISIVAALLSPGGTAIASASPSPIESESVSSLGPTDATLEAEIDTQGASAGVFYQFQLLLDPGEAPTELACPSSPPPGYSACVGPQDLGALPLESIPGNQTQTVKLDLSGAGVTLKPGRTYYFRVLVAGRVASEDTAEWEPPAIVGPSEDFTTPTEPSIVSESTSNLAMTGATLEAEIDLHEAGVGAYYQFQLVSDPHEYASEILCPPTLRPGYSGCVGPQGAGALPIGFLAGNTMQPGATSHASLDLSSAGVTLQPATAYHYRVLVARRVQTEDTIQWETPSIQGADRTFTTLSGSPSPDLQAGSGPAPGPAAIQLPPAALSLHHPRHRHRHRHHRRHRRDLSR